MSINNLNQDPIAIVGIGCRFPGGASSPEKLWQLLVDEVDAIVPIPEDRWDLRRFFDENHDKVGKTYMKEGGFLQEDIFEFDPLFFGISPREAEKLDPQQRLLLEVTWEAFEDAGITNIQFKGSKTGVFIGGFNLDNLVNRSGNTECEIVDGHTAVSSSMTMLANRLSYTFDLKGPSLTIDTACSSSLVSTHYACQSIWNGESEMAIAGGANVMLSPFYPIAMSKGHFLSSHGRSMAFDERAEGYGRGEGAAVVILKPLSAAQRDNDNIYALIKMSGANQDGQTMGISVPNGDAQKALIQEVYAKAGIKPSQVQYIEAHGTGTPTGDPIEAKALHEVVKTGRELDDKCLVGSIKTNIGHLEATAGVAGLIKASLCLKKNKIPTSLHFVNPNPNIPFDSMSIKVSDKLQDWPDENIVRYAGVNSFGYGGSNAHVLLEEATQTKTVTVKNENVKPVKLIPISAKSESALADLAAKYAYFLSSNSDKSVIDNFIYTLSQRRSHHSHRMMLLAKSEDDVSKSLQLFSMGRSNDTIISGQADLTSEKSIVFIYTGMGPQWFGMGKVLFETEEVFREAMQRCDSAFNAVSGWSVLDALLSNPEFGENITQTSLAQPANFLLQVALTELWRSWGIEPSAVIGHSVGEISAAYISGALSLEDAVKVCYERSRLQAQTSQQNGAMLAVGVSEEQIKELIRDYKNVEVAAVNSPNSVTLSGDKTQLQSLAKQLEAVFNRFLAVETAYHSQHMDMIKADVLSNLADIQPSETIIPFYSTVHGQRTSGSELNADYWWLNIRQPVRFEGGIVSLINNGFSSFLEVGPHPVLSHSIKEISLDRQVKVEQFHSLYRGRDELTTIYSSLAEFYTKGFSLDWNKLSPKGKLISVPSYPWQKKRYWRETDSAKQERFGLSGHILLNNRLPSPDPTWTVELNSNLLPFIHEHKVFGENVYPGTGYYEAAFALQKEIIKDDRCVLSDVVIHKMLFIEELRNQYLASRYCEEDNKFYLYKFFSDDEFKWDLICEGRIDKNRIETLPKKVDLQLLQARINSEYSAENLYSAIAERGLVYGKSFHSIKQLWVVDSEALLRVEMTPVQANDNNQYQIHPGLLDAAGHGALALVPGQYPFVPVTTEVFTFYGQKNIHRCWFYIKVSNVTNRSFNVDYDIYDDDGSVIAEVKNVECRLLRGLPAKHQNTLSDHVYKHRWYEYTDTFEDVVTKEVLLFTNHSPFMSAFESELETMGTDVKKVYKSHSYTNSIKTFNVNPLDKNSYKALFQDIDLIAQSQIVFAWPLASYGVEPSFSITSDDSLALISLAQALNELSLNTQVNLVILTRKSQAVLIDEVIENVNHNPLWGLGLLIMNENPKVTVRMVDLDSEDSNLDQKKYVNHILSSKALELAFRGDNVFVEKLEKVDDYNSKINDFISRQKDMLSPNQTSNSYFEHDGTYIVVGGSKGVGAEIARWLARKNVAKLILLSRSGLDDSSTSFLNELKNDAVSVEVYQLDIANEENVDQLFDYIKESCPPIKGVIHAAAVYDDDYIQNIDKTRLNNVLAPKVAGVLNLYKHLKNTDLKFLLLMSSFASVASIRRQANYIAANRFFDSFANFANAQSFPTLAINFGPISGAGQVSRDAVLDEYMSNTGLFTISVDEVIQFMEVMIGEDISNIGLYNMDWKLWGSVYEQAGRSSRFIDLTAQDKNVTNNSNATRNRNKFDGLEGSEREKFIENILFDSLTNLMKVQRNELQSQHRLNDLGMDSLMSLDFVLHIKSELNYEISTAELAKNPSLNELTTSIVTELLH